DRRSIDAVAGALPPEEIPVCSDGQDGRWLQGYARVQVDEIGRTNEGGLAEVAAAGKKGIERLQPGGGGIAIAARDIGLESDPWLEQQARPAIAGVARYGPGMNVAGAEGAELGDQLPVIVPTIVASPDPGTDRVALLAAGALVEGGAVAPEAE